jgi:chromosomal replication initiation ATPase DnaA
MIAPVARVVDELRARDLLDLVVEVATQRGVLLDQLCGVARTRSVSHARQETWWRLRHHPERCYSLLEIARLFGRHHTTVLAGIVAHERRLATTTATPAR